MLLLLDDDDADADDDDDDCDLAGIGGGWTKQMSAWARAGLIVAASCRIHSVGGDPPGCSASSVVLNVKRCIGLKLEATATTLALDSVVTGTVTGVGEEEEETTRGGEEGREGGNNG